MADSQNRITCDLVKANIRSKLTSAVGVALDNTALIECSESISPSQPEPPNVRETSGVKENPYHGAKEDAASSLDVSFTDMPCFPSSNLEGNSGRLIQTTCSFQEDPRQSPFEKGISEPPKEEPRSCLEYQSSPVPYQIVHSVPHRSTSESASRGGEVNLDVQHSLPGMSLFLKLTETFPRSLGSARFLSWTDGSFYFGQVSGDTLDGLGVYRYPDGSVYCGEWRGDRLQGNGSFMTPNGFLYRGQFEDDKQHGAGKGDKCCCCLRQLMSTTVIH